MSAIAVEGPGAARRDGLTRAALRILLLPAGLLILWGLWELVRFVGTREHVTWPFTINDTTMPHIHDIVRALFRPAQTGGPLLIHVLLKAAWFTAKEALAGFVLGGVIGFAIAVALAHSRLLQRGFLPYIVASQTVPILAIAPMVVVGLGSKGVQGWQAVAVLTAYLTFFPVTINTLRGLHAVDPRALELMRSYAASRWRILWRLRVPAALPFIFTALKISATASVIGAIIGEAPASIQDGLGGAIVNFNQYYSLVPTSLWATNLIAALLGVAFFLVVAATERLILRRAPENVA